MPPIAIVGLGVLFPGAPTLTEFWRTVVHGRDLVTEVPPHYWLLDDYYDPDPRAWGKTYARRGAFIPKVRFDPTEFGIPPRTIPNIGSVQLLALLAAKAVLGDCLSVASGKVDLQDIGVILGGSTAAEMMTQATGHVDHPHWRLALRESGISEEQIQEIVERVSTTFVEWTEHNFPGGLSNIIAGRITNRLGLGGTNCVVDAACASSLAALSMAVHELQLGHSDLVISGGADANNDAYAFMCFSKTPALSFTGDCRPFSDKADGTILGEGVGLAALRRLADAERDGDKIYGVIRGIGSSSDGRAKSIYAPLASGQALAYRRAYERAGVSPAEVELVEAHGTATPANDAAEFKSLTTVYREVEPTRRQWCALGSIKSQIGHTKAAAGAASLIKAALALHHKVLPPTIKVEKPNPDLEIEKSPFYLNTVARPWIHDAGSTRKAVVSSLGFGGTNFHIVLEEYRGPGAKPKRVRTSSVELLLLGAEDERSLTAAMAQLERRSTETPLEVLARETQQAFDPAIELRLALVATSPEDLRSLLDEAQFNLASAPGVDFSAPHRLHLRRDRLPREIAFLFPGQASQYLDMGRDLAVEFEPFRRTWDDVAALHAKEALGLHQVVYPRPSFDEAELEQQKNRLRDTRWAQPAIGAVSLGYLALLERLGIKPAWVGGHGYGEVPALFVAGAISSLADLMSISHECGRVTAEASARGCASGMTAVNASPHWLQTRLEQWGPSVSIASVNAPEQILIAGAVVDLERVENQLAQASIQFKRLPVSAAFHSPHMRDAETAFRRFLDPVRLSGPTMPVFSSTTGACYPGEPDRIRDVLAGQLSRPVFFKDEIEAMHAAGARIFLEVGPGRALTGLVSACLKGSDHLVIPLDGQPGDGVTGFWNALGVLASAGVPIDFAALREDFTVETETAPRACSETTIEIDGSNRGKPYPPPAGQVRRPATATRTVNATHPAAPGESPVRGSPDGELRAAIEQIQANLLDAQKTFQESQTRSHLAFIKVSAELMSALTGSVGEDAKSEDARTPVEGPYQPASADSAEIPPGRQGDLAPAAGSPAGAPAPIAGQSAAAPGDPGTASAGVASRFEDALLDVVSELTGYPKSVLDLDADIEADLGIDSIKKVEVLAAFQSRVPELKIEDPKSLFSLMTLREIMDRVRVAGTVSTSPTDATPTLQGAASWIQRLVVESVPTDEPCEILPGLDASGTIQLVEDNRGVAPLLAENLGSLGYPTRIVREVSDDAGSVIFLKGIDTAPPAGEIDSFIEVNRAAFETARRCAPRFRDHGGVFVTVQDTGGDLNVSGDSGSRAWCGGLAALAKTIAQEWPRVSVKAIDVQCRDQGPEDIAEMILRELTQGGCALEVGLRPGGRRVHSAVRPRGLDGSGVPLPGDRVVLASGGARGITAACLKAMARRSPVKFAVIGTTSIGPESSDPRSAEARSTLKELEAAGAAVRYFQGDVRDPRVVDEVVRQVHGSWGSIQVVLHGAGINVDNPVHQKSIAEFDGVLSTKVVGLKNLLAATRDDVLTHICCFSSVVARRGNPGQADYAMANEILNKVCQSEARARDGACRVKALNWGPWDGGMVQEHHKRLFELGGYRVLPLELGGQLFVREIEDPGRDGPVEIILCGTTTGEGSSRPAPATDGRSSLPA